MHPVGIGAFVQGDEQGAAREAGGQRGTHGRQVAGRGKGGVIEGAAQPSRNACRFPCGGEVEREQVAGDLGKHRRLSGDQAGDEQGDAHARGGGDAKGSEMALDGGRQGVIRWTASIHGRLPCVRVISAPIPYQRSCPSLCPFSQSVRP